MNKPHKPFRETKFAVWLKEHDSELFAFMAERWPDKRPVGKFVKIIFMCLSKLTDEKKNEGAKLIEKE